MRRLQGTTVTIAGSLRRRRAMIGDVDVLVIAASPAPVVERFVRYPRFARIAVRGSVRATAYLDAGLQVDLRVVAPAVSGAALLYFTGSKAHNIELRRIARTKKLKLNEYGLFRDDRLVAGSTEQSIYRALGLRWVAPANREGVESIKLASR
jgi:DNA polymerase (family 10)